MIPGVNERFQTQLRESALVWGQWSTASGVPTKLNGHNNLELTNVGTGLFSLTFRGGCREMLFISDPTVQPATPATRANARQVVVSNGRDVNDDTPALTFATWLNATEAVAASAANPQDGSIITCIAIVAK